MRQFCKGFIRVLTEEPPVDEQLNKYLSDNPDVELLSISYAPPTKDADETLIAVLRRTEPQMIGELPDGTLPLVTLTTPVVTNYDKIHGLSLDEMADFLDHCAVDCSGCFIPPQFCCEDYNTCADAIRNWLTQPAKEESN